MIRAAFSVTLLAGSPGTLRLDGIGRYTEELLRTLRQPGGAEMLPYVFLRQSSSAGSGSALNLGTFKTQALTALLTGAPFASTRQLRACGVNLLHATDHFIPKLRGIPVVATLHDAIPLSHPEWISYSFKSVKNALWRKSAQWADHVITVSNHSKREISRWFGIPPEKISAIPLGVDGRWAQPVPVADLERVRANHGLPPRFFLFLGTLQPRKNVGRLIAAHRLLPASLRREVPLVVAGRAGWQCGEELAALRDGDGNTLRYLDHVPESDLLPLLKQAAVFVLPSLHEGFGLPILEAFAAGIPVVSTTAGSIPEVAGEAALLVDPLDIRALADAMHRCLEDSTLSRSLREQGRKRAETFTWARAAASTLEVYRQVTGCRTQSPTLP